MTMSVPGPKAGSTPPAAFVRTTTRAPRRWNSSTGWTTRPGSLPSYRWNRPWSIDDRAPAEPAEQQPPDVARAPSPPASRAARRTGSRRRPRARRRARRARSPRTIPTLRDEVGPGADGGLERVEPGGLVGRRDRPARGRSAGSPASGRGHGRAGLRDRVPGDDGRGPLGFGARRTYRHRDAGRVRRAHRPGGRAEAAGVRQRSARSDRRGAEVLDVISVSPVPDGPFGQDDGTARPTRRVNGVVHELAGVHASRRIHEFSTDVDERGQRSRSPTRPARTSRAAAARRTSPRSAPRSSGRRGRRQIAATASRRAPSPPTARRPRARVAERPPAGRAHAAEEARVELALGGEAGPGAVAAERLRHRRDDADLAAPVAVAPALATSPR